MVENKIIVKSFFKNKEETHENRYKKEDLCVDIILNNINSTKKFNT